MQIPNRAASVKGPIHHGLNRRRFLQYGAGLWTLAATVPGALLAKCSFGLKLVQNSRRGLGTTMTLKVLHEDEEVARQAIDAAFKELEEIEATLSIYRSDSQVSQLNHHGFLNDPDARLVQILTRSAYWSKQTNGAFDITVQPLWDLYHEARKSKTLPRSEDLQQARQKIDWRQLSIHEKVVQLKHPGAAITLNGIAQGFAADCVTSILKTRGIEHALIHCGEIGAMGTNLEGQPWTVGIQHPRQSDAYSALAYPDDRAISTSGDYATTFSSDFRNNHLFDPKTGHSPEELASVSVSAPHAMDADALSTAISVMGTQKGLDLIRRLDNADALMVTKSGRTLITEGFPCNPS